MRSYIRPFVLLLSVAIMLRSGAWQVSGALVESNAERARNFVTNVAQFRTLSGADLLAGCDFRLTGIVTLTDTNRHLVVLQDTTGALAINFSPYDYSLQAGQLVTLEGEN